MREGRICDDARLAVHAHLELVDLAQRGAFEADRDAAAQARPPAPRLQLQVGELRAALARAGAKRREAAGERVHYVRVGGIGVPALQLERVLLEVVELPLARVVLDVGVTAVADSRV